MSQTAERNPRLIAEALVAQLDKVALHHARERVAVLKESGDLAAARVWAEIVGEITLLVDDEAARRRH
jgi:hypothetical protein